MIRPAGHAPAVRIGMIAGAGRVRRPWHGWTRGEMESVVSTGGPIARLKHRYAPTIARAQQHRLGQLAQNYFDDDPDGLASMLAYAAMFSLLPIMTVTFLIITLLLEISFLRNEVLDYIAYDVPSSVRLVAESMFSGGSGTQVLLGIVAFFTFLLGGNRLYNAMDRTCAQVFRAPKRSSVQRRLLTLVMMPLIPLLLLASTLVAVAATALMALPVERIVDIDTSVEQAVLVYLSAFLLAFSMLFLAYWKIPTKPPTVRAAADGGAVAAVLVIILAQGFSLYLEIFGGGSLSSGVFAFSLLILLWLYLFGQVFVIGAEIAALRSGFRERPVPEEQAPTG